MPGTRVMGWMNAGVALALVLSCGWLIHAAHAAADDAVRRYGHNVDSGALEFAVAVLYVAPVSILFACASLTHFRSWRVRGPAQWLALAGLVLPPAVSVLSPLAAR